MDGMEEKIGTILSDPNMMQQIMSMAQALSQTDNPPQKKEAPRQEQPQPALPGIDPAMLQKLAGMAGQGTIDRNQQALLKALGPYLSRTRLDKLEKAMRAARMAGIASVFLSQGGTQFLTGR